MDYKENLLMTPQYEKALKEGMTHCVSYILRTDNPLKPWRQTFFKSRLEAQHWEKWVTTIGGRAILGGMRMGVPR